MGEVGLVLVARRGGGCREAATRCDAIVPEAPHSRCQVLPRRHLVSLQI